MRRRWNLIGEKQRTQEQQDKPDYNVVWKLWRQFSENSWMNLPQVYHLFIALCPLYRRLAMYQEHQQYRVRLLTGHKCTFGSKNRCQKSKKYYLDEDNCDLTKLLNTFNVPHFWWGQHRKTDLISIYLDLITSDERLRWDLYLQRPARRTTWYQ